jgi:hypothetical protein
MEGVDLRSGPRGRGAHVIERVPRLEDLWRGLDAERLVLGQGFRERAVDLRLLGLGESGRAADPLFVAGRSRTRLILVPSRTNDGRSRARRVA